MSVENVKKFYEAVTRDEALKQKFVELSQKYQCQPMDEAKFLSLAGQELLPIAKQSGYEFTLDDLHAFGEKQNAVHMNCELSDEELQAVVGGTTEARCYFLGYYSNGNFACFMIGDIYYSSESYFRCFLCGEGHNTNT